MKRIVLLCLILFLTFASDANAANWQYIMTTNGGELVFFDAETITINEAGYLDVWSKWVFPPKKGSNLSYYLSHEQYDSMPRSIRYMGIYAYDGDREMIDKTIGPTKWYEIIPDSCAEIFYNKVLSYYVNKMGREVKNL